MIGVLRARRGLDDLVSPTPMTKLSQRYLGSAAWNVTAATIARRIPGASSWMRYPWTATRTFAPSGVTMNPLRSCHQTPSSRRRGWFDHIIVPARRSPRTSPSPRLKPAASLSPNGLIHA